MSPPIDEIDPTHVLHEPPELTRAIATDRWREINLLLHSIVLLGDELEGGGPLLPVLRAAATMSACDRALLYQWDEVRGALRLTTALGFPGGLPASPGAGELTAGACLLYRKPVLLADTRATRLAEGLRCELRTLGARSVLCVPLTHQGMPWGALQVLRDRPFERDDAILLWLFALVLEGVLPSLMGPKRHREMTLSTDPATGLLTPDQFRRRLSWEMQRSAWLTRPLTVACIEVTEMLHGRPRGASLTFTPREASAVLQRSLRQSDSATCLGGHHFIAAMPDTSRADAEPVTELVREGLLLRSAGTLPVFDVITGFAVFPEDGKSESDLMRAACAAGRRRGRPISRNPLAG